MRKPNVSSFLSSNAWTQRVRDFTPAWFTCTMGVGIVSQVLHNFPYPAGWLQRLSYCVWILDIVLVAFFTLMGLLRVLLFPSLAFEIFQDLQQTCLLGAIPISIDGIAAGVALFYSDRSDAVWTAYALWWVAVVLTLLVGIAAVVVMASLQEERALMRITGVSLLSFIPFIVTSGTGGLIAPLLDIPNLGTTIIVSFLYLATGELVCFLIVTTYFHRLLTRPLPPRDNLLSVFVPMGPTGMGAYSVQAIAGAFSQYLGSVSTSNTMPQYPRILAVFVASPMLVLSTFFLIHGLATLAVRRTVLPKAFTPAIWGIVFPIGVYANGIIRVAKSLQDLSVRGGEEWDIGLAGLGSGAAYGFRVWGCCASILLILAFLMCSGWCFWRGVWCGQMAGDRSTAADTSHAAVTTAQGEEMNVSTDSSSDGSVKMPYPPMTIWRRV